LHQASHQWSKKLHECLTKEGFMCCAVEHSIYTQTDETGTVILAIHVDVMPITVSSPVAMIGANLSLQKYFEIVDLGLVKLLLGICINQNRTGHTITLSQTAYINSVVTHFHLEDAFKVKMLMDTSVHLTKQSTPNTIEEWEHMSKLPYLALVGSLMYASMGTCPDITHTVSNLGKYSSNPGKTHWTATQCVLQYLNGTCDLGLVLGGKQPITLQGHVDSDFAQDLDDWKSISGYTFNLGSGTISWSSKKQVTVAGSSMEAEYIATDNAIKEAMWLRTLLSLLSHPQPGPTLIWCDNMGAISLIKNPMFHVCTKHIVVKHHYVWDRYELKEITFEYVPTADNSTDILTKGLDHPKHWKFLSMLGLKSKLNLKNSPSP